MSTTIDTAGRLVVPKAVREAAGIRPGTPLEVRFRDGRIEIEPSPVEVRIEDEGGVSVAVAQSPVPVLSAAVTDEVLASLRGERR